MATHESDLLFVYGTLRSDVNHAAHRLLKDEAQRVGPAGAAGHRLYDLGAYPAMTGAPPGDDEARVIGEIYRMRDPASFWPRLDAYEGATQYDGRAPLFERKLIMVRLDRGAPREAWTYLYARAMPKRAKRITSGDYAEHLARSKSS